MNNKNLEKANFLQKINIKLPTDLNALKSLIFQFNKIESRHISRKDWLQCELALVEGFTNAVRHAHKELPQETPIEIEATLTSDAMEIRIWDFGAAANLEQFIKKMNQTINNKIEGARGIPIMRKIADFLSYTRTSDERNCLLIIKRLKEIKKNPNQAYHNNQMQSVN